MRLLVRRLILAALVCLVLLLSLGVALGIALQTLQRDPQALTQRLTALLPEKSGFSVSLGTVSVRLLPVPRLVASDVSINGPGVRAAVAYVVATPSLTGILRGDALPAALTLYHPQITASLPVKSFLAAEEGSGAGSLPPLPSFQVRIQQGQAVLYARDGSALSLVNARCSLRGRGQTLKGSAGFSSLTLYDSGARPLAGLINTSLEGEAPLADWSQRETHLRLETQAALPPVLPIMSLALELEGRPADGMVTADVRGRLRVGSALVPFGIGGQAECRADEARDGLPRAVSLRRWQLELAEDSARLDGVLRLGAAGETPSLAGHLVAHRLSLTRWLDFARDLPPGLQWALDNITRGEADFELDGKGLRVPRVTARSSGSVFEGSGGVASWEEPVVALDLKAPSVNIGLALPEAVGSAPEAPFYVHPPLTSAYDDPGAPSSFSLGFDIRLGAQRLLYGPLRLEDASVRITPGPKKNGLEEGALLTGKASLYGGRLASETHITGTGQENVYRIDGTVQGVRTAELARDMASFPFASGRCDARISLESRGLGLDAFLRHLRGSLHADVTQGRFRSGMDSAIRDFARITLDVTPRGGRAFSEGGRGAARLEALWKAHLESPGLEADVQLDGPLIFGGRSRLRTEAAALRGNLHMPPGAALPQGLTAGVAGQCAFNIGTSAFSLQRAALSTLGVEGQGDLHLDGGGKVPSWRGTLHLQCRDLGATLRQATGQSPDLPAPLRRWQVSGNFSGQAGSLAVTGMQARASQISLEGDASLQWKGARPDLRFDLVSPHFDLDAFMAAAFPDTGGRNDASGQPWDLRAMKAFDAEGVLHVQRLTAWKFNLSSLSVPLKLREGRLRCDAVELALDVKADDIDVERASNDRGGEKAVGGRGSIDLELRQHMKASGQWASSLNGLWKMSLIKGYMQDRGRDGRRKGNATPIARCSASGNIRSGVIRSSDFFYLGDDLQAQGGGWLHLVRKQMDCNLSVKMRCCAFWAVSPEAWGTSSAACLAALVSL